MYANNNESLGDDNQTSTDSPISMTSQTTLTTTQNRLFVATDATEQHFTSTNGSAASSFDTTSTYSTKFNSTYSTNTMSSYDSNRNSSNTLTHSVRFTTMKPCKN